MIFTLPLLFVGSDVLGQTPSSGLGVDVSIAGLDFCVAVFLTGDMGL